MTPYETATAMVGELCRDGRPVYYLNRRDDAPVEYDSRHAAAWAALRAGMVADYQPKVSKVFGAFTAEIEPCEDRDSVYCDVTHRHTGLSNSLNFLANEGHFGDLPRDSDRLVVVTDRVLEAIETWAYSHGY